MCDARSSGRSFSIDIAADGANAAGQNRCKLDTTRSEPVPSVIILLCGIKFLLGCFAVKMVKRRKTRARAGERARIEGDRDDAVNSSVVDRSRLDAEAGGDDGDGLDARGDQVTATHEERK